MFAQVTVIPNQFTGAIQAATDFFAHILKDEQGERVEQIRQDPAALAELARITRSARELGGGIDILAETLDLPKELLEEADLAFPAGLDERTTRALLESNSPELAAKLTTAETELGLRGVEAEGELGLPEARAAGELDEITTETIRNAFERQEIELQEETINRYKEILDSPDVSEHMKQFATLALQNPVMAQHFAQHEQWKLEENASALSSRGSPGDVLGTFVKLNEERDRLLAIIGDGENSKDRRINAGRALSALADVEQWLVDVGAVQSSTAAARGRIEKGLTGTSIDVDQIEFDTPQAKSLSRLFVTLIQADPSLELLNTELSNVAGEEIRFESVEDIRNSLRRVGLSPADANKVSATAERAIAEARGRGEGGGFGSDIAGLLQEQSISEIMNAVTSFGGFGDPEAAQAIDRAIQGELSRVGEKLMDIVDKFGEFFTEPLLGQGEGEPGQAQAPAQGGGEIPAQPTVQEPDTTSSPFSSLVNDFVEVVEGLDDEDARDLLKRADLTDQQIEQVMRARSGG